MLGHDSACSLMRAGVVQLRGDITRPATWLRIQGILSAESNASSSHADADTCESGLAASSDDGRGFADVVVCDGAPDVTGLHDLDSHLGQGLVLAALGACCAFAATAIPARMLRALLRARIASGAQTCGLMLQTDASRHAETCRALLRPGGTFVAKCFIPDETKAANRGEGGRGQGGAFERSQLYIELRACFDQIALRKPHSSRATSCEMFVVCRGFRGERRGGYSQSVLPDTDAVNLQQASPS
jgi:23S rRNA U2552 (ribose-2'-O)-methylase RlmE/FtsJ